MGDNTCLPFLFILFNMRKYIIIFCCKEDEHANQVLNKIDSNKYQVVLLERETYGAKWTISSYTDDGKIKIIISLNNQRFDSSEINSIYLRRDFTIDSQDILGAYSDSEKKYIATQRAIHVNSCIKLLSNAIPTINSPEANYRCLSKILQLDLALKVGINVPKSFFGGYFSASFLNLENTLCIKPLEGVHLKEKDKTYAHYSEILTDKSKESLKTLEECPAIIQSYIKKEFELRITVVGNRIFPCKIESQKSSVGKIDWRHHDWANTPHYKTEIPKDLEKKLIKLMQKLGLIYGAIDMIFDGKDYFFLEVNSMGQWLWIEDFTEMPISKEIANYLSIERI